MEEGKGREWCDELVDMLCRFRGWLSCEVDEKGKVIWIKMWNAEKTRPHKTNSKSHKRGKPKLTVVTR